MVIDPDKREERKIGELRHSIRVSHVPKCGEARQESERRSLRVILF